MIQIQIKQVQLILMTMMMMMMMRTMMTDLLKHQQIKMKQQHQVIIQYRQQLQQLVIVLHQQ